MISPPDDLDRRPRALLAELTAQLPEEEVARHCAALLAGADPRELAWLLPWLAGKPGRRWPAPGWADHWPRVWGARGLLHVWAESAAPAVVAGVDDPAWRVAEMCLKVARRHELPVGDAAASLVGHELPRVRVAALRALAECGETEHLPVVLDAVGRRDEGPAVTRAAGLALERLSERLDRPSDHFGRT